MIWCGTSNSFSVLPLPIDATCVLGLAAVLTRLRGTQCTWATCWCLPLCTRWTIDHCNGTSARALLDSREQVHDACLVPDEIVRRAHSCRLYARRLTFRSVSAAELENGAGHSQH